MSRVRAEFATAAPPAAPIGETGHGALLRHLRGLVAEISALRLLRQAVFLGAVLLSWITLKPFPNLSRLDIGDLVTGQEGLTYALFGLVTATALALVLAQHRRAFASLVTPVTLSLSAWLCVSVVLSQDSGTSAKRLILTAAVLLLTSCLPLLPQTRNEFRDLLAAAALILLTLCYLGLLLAPQLSIHQPNDLVEPHLAGNWRGTFGHKNGAAAVMAMLLFVGVGVFRLGARAAGAAIVVLAATFLIGCEGKSAFGLSLVVFGLTSLFALVRSFALRAALTIGPVVVLNLLSVGAVMNDALAKLVAMLPIDATFTGRSDIWKFAVESIAARPMTGYGFSAFWGNQWVRDVSADAQSWAGLASHSHNGYLDAVLTLGLVGLALLLLFLVVGPLRDYQRASSAGGEAAPLATLFLQIWLFGILLASMESFFFDRADPIWFTFLIAVFGLRYLANFRTR